MWNFYAFANLAVDETDFSPVEWKKSMEKCKKKKCDGVNDRSLQVPI